VLRLCSTEDAGKGKEGERGFLFTVITQIIPILQTKFTLQGFLGIFASGQGMTLCDD